MNPPQLTRNLPRAPEKYHLTAERRHTGPIDIAAGIIANSKESRRESMTAVGAIGGTPAGSIGEAVPAGEASRRPKPMNSKSGVEYPHFHSRRGRILRSPCLSDNAGESIAVYCALDSDYHDAVGIQDRFNQAMNKDVDLHVWNAKEIENYLICPKLIPRLIAPRVRDVSAGPTSDKVEAAFDEVAEGLRVETIENSAEAIGNRDRKLGVKAANARAKQHVFEH